MSSRTHLSAVANDAKARVSITSTAGPSIVMAGALDFSSCPARSQACADCVNLSALPGIYVLFFCDAIKTWMVGTSRDTG
jgi:hypothetical protein